MVSPFELFSFVLLSLNKDRRSYIFPVFTKEGARGSSVKRSYEKCR
jgi:hypothetical protein